ncbi:hypothetical protein T4D_1431 [Trichinella pseudospiralis]|uniref:Uncharacterized protein n=1 Tax=Trichinella pseudospiralis TaxID=6337 RepID=A0A0V1DLH1_TRIPS|nr:hypothetical protein T4D_1431 [Trichinella pseudospiralis]
MSAAVECLGLLCLSVARRWEEGTWRACRVVNYGNLLGWCIIG